MSTVDLDAIRDLAARYVDTPWDGEDGADLACDLAVQVPALVDEVTRLRAVERDHACIPVEYAYAEGYAAAVAALRDEERYSNWWTSTDVQPVGTVRQHLADYLETVGPARATREDT